MRLFLSLWSTSHSSLSYLHWIIFISSLNWSSTSHHVIIVTSSLVHTHFFKVLSSHVQGIINISSLDYHYLRIESSLPPHWTITIPYQNHYLYSPFINFNSDHFMNTHRSISWALSSVIYRTVRWRQGVPHRYSCRLWGLLLPLLTFKCFHFIIALSP